MAILRVKDENGNVYDIPVIKGDKGADGYTPVKGVDYYTDEDKVAFQQQIDEALSDHLASTENPHAVTKEQVGLGKVDNTSDADKPVSTLQKTAIEEAKKAGTDAQTTIGNHVANKENPHGVTAEQVGAAEEDHEHSAADISSGTFPVARGGTGKTTHTSNAVLTGNANGAMYATAANGAPKFGTLPVAQGGTGKTTAEAALLNLGGIKIVKLWENASPASSFAAQILALDLSGYDGVEVLYLNGGTGESYMNSGFIPKGKLCNLWYVYSSGNQAYRQFTASDTGIDFTEGHQGGIEKNSVIIPVIIYGIKGVK